jgi:hypothetical protein
VTATLVGLVIGMLATSRPVAAQSIGCTLPANSNRLEVTLPKGVLDRLETMSNSTFVQAFLIATLAQPEAGHHRLSECARAFTNAKATDINSLRASVPDAASMIQALREAEADYQVTLKLQSSLADSTLDSIMMRLKSDTAVGGYDASIALLQTVKVKKCTAASPACDALSKAINTMSTWASRTATVKSLEQEYRQRQVGVATIRENLETARASRAADSVAHMSKADGDPNAKNEWIELEKQWNTEIGRLVTALDSAEQWSAKRQAATDAETDAMAARALMNEALTSLQTHLGTIPNLVQAEIAALPTVHAGAPGVDIAPEPATLTAPERARSGAIATELVDFIIERAKHEMVNSFIINLHRKMDSSVLLQSGFPDTWALMRGLDRRKDNLDALAVGRIPMNVWRATFASDFVKFPIHMLNDGSSLCHATVDTDGLSADSVATLLVKAKAVESTCHGVIAGLKPLFPVAKRLVEGEDALDILLHAATLISPTDPELPTAWRTLNQGLSILEAVVESYHAQDWNTVTDVVRFPYLMSPDAIQRVPRQQRDAFLRLLVVRVVPADAKLADDAPAAVEGGVLQVTKAIQQLARRQTDASAQITTAQLFRTTFDALAGAADIATALGVKNSGLDLVKKRWVDVSAAIEPIAAHNYGLALSRTTVLLRDIRGHELPANVLTLTSLASALTEARDGKQIRAAFEAAASPVGGWQAKRYGDRGVSITAYPGAAIGGEWMWKEKFKEPAMSTGVALPIGIEFANPAHSPDDPDAEKCSVKCSFGLFIPLVDMGALLSYRVTKTDVVNSEPNGDFRQVFAPGMYLSFGMSRTVPLTLLLGGQVMPELRKVTASPTHARSAFRFGLSVGLDVSLFRL